MTANKGFDKLDAVPCAAPASTSIAHGNLKFPCTLKEIAKSEGLNYNTLKNKYFALKVQPIYHGFDVQPLKTDRGMITKFGYQCIMDYVNQVVREFKSYSEYVSEVQSLLTKTKITDSEIVDGEIVEEIPGSELQSLSIVPIKYGQKDYFQLSVETSENINLFRQLREEMITQFIKNEISNDHELGIYIGKKKVEAIQQGIVEGTNEMLVKKSDDGNS